MTSDSARTEDRIARARAGDQDALADLFECYRNRLRKLVHLRLDRRLQGRVDASDVLQEAYLDVVEKLPGYEHHDDTRFFLWLRLVTGERLLQVHRRHLGTKKRDAEMEVSLYPRSMPVAESASLAFSLFGDFTSPSHGAMRAEIQIKLQEMLNSMDPIDREILVLRHMEELSNEEAAQALDLKKTAASNRYMRALKRLRVVLAGMPGFRAE